MKKYILILIVILNTSFIAKPEFWNGVAVLRSTIYYRMTYSVIIQSASKKGAIIIFNKWLKPYRKQYPTTEAYKIFKIKPEEILK